jgi:hypothetical protein
VNSSPFKFGIVRLFFLLFFTYSTHYSNTRYNADFENTILSIFWNPFVLLDFFGFYWLLKCRLRAILRTDWVCNDFYKVDFYFFYEPCSNSGSIGFFWVYSSRFSTFLSVWDREVTSSTRFSLLSLAIAIWESKN